MCSYCGCMYVDGGYSKVVQSVEDDYGPWGRFRSDFSKEKTDKKKSTKRTRKSKKVKDEK